MRFPPVVIPPPPAAAERAGTSPRIRACTGARAPVPAIAGTGAEATSAPAITATAQALLNIVPPSLQRGVVRRSGRGLERWFDRDREAAEGLGVREAVDH